MPDSMPTPPQRLEDIAPSSWEHPADRAALQTLRALPGFDQVVRKTIGFLGERGIRLAFQANAVRVGPRQLPTLHRLQLAVQDTLDWPEEVPVFVSQHPWFNAGAYGVDRPFVVLHSAALDLLDERELRVLLGHELGHVMSGHALYRTMLALLLAFGLQQLPFLAGVALLPVRLALLEWSRKSELSADRAGLLAAQDPDAAVSMLMRAAGGSITARAELDLAAYRQQVAEYEGNEGLDSLFKILNLMDQTHPFHTLRAAALERWVAAGDYADILGGHYRRRDERQTAGSYGADVRDAAAYYASQARVRAGELGQVAREVAQRTGDAARSAAADATEAARQVVGTAAGLLGSSLERRRPR